MLDSLSRLGLKYSKSKRSELFVEPGIDIERNVTLDARQSGVSLRLLLALATLRTGMTSYIGYESLAKRPNKPLLDAIAELGCKVKSDEGFLPSQIQGTALHSETTLDASLSSQYLTALLCVGPLFKKGLAIKTLGEVASKPYIDITLNELRRRGVNWRVTDDRFQVDHSHYSGGTVYVEGDASAATYHMALATLHGSQVKLQNLGKDTIQGDYEFATVCERLGATVIRKSSTTVIQGPKKLNDIEHLDFSLMPDAALTLMAIAPYLNKPIAITGLETLPHKECDRIQCPAIELAKAGIHVETGPDYMKIWPGTPNAAKFETYDDHRMAMSFAVLASKTNDCRIENPICVNKTYTEFWRDFSLAYA